MPRPLVSAACVAAFTVAGVVAWATPRPLGDLYLALAGGRDVLAGKLGTPDDWSFLTEGRVWMNQSWGSDLLFFLVHRAAGETGLLVLKGVLIGGIGLAVIAVARRRGAGLASALLAAALALAAAPQDLVLRPSLFSFLLVPVLILILDRARSRPRWLAAAALLVGLWANLHGGFIFGLGMLALWVAEGLIPGGDVSLEKPGRRLVPPAALVAALLLAGLANPFGWRNLVLPLALPSSVWQNVTEWRPLFAPEPFGIWLPWAFFLVVALAVGPSLWRWARGGARLRAAGIAEGILAGVVLFMAVQAKRFVPLAAVVLAPGAALEIDRVLGNGKRLAAIALLVAAAIAVEQRGILRDYDPGNPFRPPETLLERMTRTRTDFPVGGGEFLRANRVSGRIYHEWRWEGYLRWVHPDLALFMGGRAHQVYREEDARLRREILAAPDPAARLRELGVGLAAVPLEAEFAPLVARLLSRGGASWAYVYVDGRTAVLADTETPEGNRLVGGAVAGSLVYPDSATAFLSRGMCLASSGSGAPPDSAYRELRAAVRAGPVDFAYPLLVERARLAGIPDEEILDLLTGELARLATFPVRVAGGAEFLECRERVAGLVLGLASPADAERRNLASSTLVGAERELKDLTRAYTFVPLAVKRAGSGG